MENPIKLFISYSWTTPEHEEWVLNLSTELRENGVYVILDKWNLREGNDAHAFMEQMVTDELVTKVLIICDRGYVEKANKREGGAGVETQIITPEIYQNQKQNKFVAVIAERDDAGKPYVPVYYKSRIYIDLSNDELYSGNFERLLRWIYDKPLYQEPELGKKPSFLNEEPHVSLGTSAAFRRMMDAIKTSKPHALGATQEYFELFSTNLEKFRIAQSQGNNEWDEKVIDVIEKFKPYHDEAIEVFIAIARYSRGESFGDELHHFFESLIPYMYRPNSIHQWNEWDWDYYKFIIHELFLYCVAVLLKHERFGMMSQLVRPYLVIDPLGNRNKIKSFSLFREYLKILEYRKKRLSSVRISLHSDLLKERASKNVNFDLLMQADFLLFIIDVIQLSKETKNFDDLKLNQRWFPYTLIYKADYFESNPFDIFLKSESKQYFDKLKIVLGINAKSELLPMIGAFERGELSVPNWGFGYAISPKFLMNFDKLCTRD